MESSAKPRPGIGEILGVFTRLGMASFGGGLPGWMHREVVLKRRWMPEESFLAGIALGQVLPGPNSVNLAIHIGQQLRGVPGAAAAFLGILGPPFLFILGLALLYGWGAGVAGLGPVLAGVAAAGLANSATVGLRTARRMRGPGPWAVVAATFLAVGVLRLPMIPVVLLLAPLSIALAWAEAPDRRRAGGRGPGAVNRPPASSARSAEGRGPGAVSRPPACKGQRGDG